MDLSGQELSGAVLTQADMKRTKLRGIKADEAVFDGTDLRYAVITDSLLLEANLAVAKLRHADLRGSDLSGANLQGADLSGADLRGAHLDGAKMRGAIMLDTQIWDTDLSRAEGLAQAQIAKARGNAETKLPFGLRLPEKI